MENRYFLIFICLICAIGNSFSQQNQEEFSILFYNVENLFDTRDNPETDDDNYAPEGELRWTTRRLNEKLLNISKVILSASGWYVPDIIVLAEIENREALEKLKSDTPLKSFPFKIIHKESPDHRGIDVSLMYNSERFYPLEYKFYPLVDEGKVVNTREVLYVLGVLNGKDTLHIFGNHWPSRFSGFMETKSLRLASAALLRSKVDELFKTYSYPKIVIIGDFNDNPEDESISEVLLAGKVEQPYEEEKLYNLFSGLNSNKRGTLKYQSQWFLFDQVIVSGSLLMGTSGINTKPGYAKILEFPFLLEADRRFGGDKPFRTYFGFTYNGGFSDHLPVLLKLENAD